MTKANFNLGAGEHCAKAGSTSLDHREARPVSWRCDRLNAKAIRSGLPVGQAETLSEAQIRILIAYAEQFSSSPVIGRVKILFSFFAGLRACEIAGLRIENITDASGRVANHIRIRGITTKNGRDRPFPCIPS